MVGIITISSPVDGSTVANAVTSFVYSISDVTLGVGNIEVSIDGAGFFSVLEGELNQNLNDSGFFPKAGSFDVEFEHGLHSIEFRVVDRLNNVQDPATSFTLNVDIATTVTIDPLPPFVNNSTLILTGTRETGASVAILVNGSSSGVGPVTFPTTTTWTATVVLQEGSNTIQATAEDLEGNMDIATASIILDTVAPAPPVIVKINPAAPNFADVFGATIFTNEPSQEFVGTKETLTSIRINAVEVVPLDASTDWTTTVALSEGTNLLAFTVVDQANNISLPVDVTIVLDTIAPGSPDIVINDGVEFTLTRDVTLRLSATDATEVKVSEDANFANAEFVPFDSAPLFLPFELSRGGGIKTVFAVFRDAVGNETVPVFDSIILPDTISTAVERVSDMTVQAFKDVTPDNVDYFIRLEDNRDGTFSIDIFNTLLDATNQTNRVGFASSVAAGEQTLSLTPDGGGIDPGGSIIVTLIEGAETIIYRFRTDVFDLSEDELTTPIVYSLVTEKGVTKAQTQVSLFEGFAYGRVLETNVDGDLKKLRISKSFDLEDEDTAIVENTYYSITDQDGALFSITGARFFYPLHSTSFEILNLEEEDDAYLISLDTDFTNFNAIFGYEISFSKRRGLVTDYQIFDDGRVEFLNESGVASGNVEITYRTPQLIESLPSAEFVALTGFVGDDIAITVEPTENLILISDLDRVCLRIFHSLESSTTAPDVVSVTINDTYTASTSAFTVVAENSRAQIREYCLDKNMLFPGLGEEDGYSAQNPVLTKAVISFTATADITYTDEVQVIAKSSVVSSNCRIVINGEEVFRSEEPVSSRFDAYEIQHQMGEIDILCNGDLVYGQSLDLSSATASVVAGARVDGDRLDAALNKFTTINYLDASPSTLSLFGRFVEAEVTLRSNSVPLLGSYEYDFASPEPATPARVFAPTVLSDEFTDTATVAILGVGQREEILVTQGSGEEDEGEPVDFAVTNSSDGRHFQVTSFPIVTGTLRVFLTHKGTERLLSDGVDFTSNLNNGYVVLFHPIALSDLLRVEYTSLADINQPELFLNLEDLVVKHGAPSLENTLSLGASLAFQNGAKRVVAVQALDPTQDTGWIQAFKALEKEEAYYVVPIPPNNYPLVSGTGLDHVEDESETPRRHERVLILGETEDLTDTSLFTGSFRTVFLRPGQLTSVVDGETLSLDGRYLAAAYAGKASSLNQVAEPMMGESLVGFVIDERSKFSNLQLDQAADDGVTIIKRLSAGGRAYKSVTTSSSILAVEQEQSVVRIRDFLAKNIRKTLEDRFVGQVVIQEVLDNIRVATTQFLEREIDNRHITEFRNVRVDVDSEEPRQANVSFDVEPVFPLTNIALRIRVVAQL